MSLKVEQRLPQVLTFNTLHIQFALQFDVSKGFVVLWLYPDMRK